MNRADITIGQDYAWTTSGPGGRYQPHLSRVRVLGFDDVEVRSHGTRAGGRTRTETQVRIAQLDDDGTRRDSYQTHVPARQLWHRWEQEEANRRQAAKAEAAQRDRNAIRDEAFAALSAELQRAGFTEPEARLYGRSSGTGDLMLTALSARLLTEALRKGRA